MKDSDKIRKEHIMQSKMYYESVEETLGFIEVGDTWRQNGPDRFDLTLMQQELLPEAEARATL